MDRNWFKSRIGFDDSDAERIDSFCTYASLPQSPDVYVILDSLKSDIFKNNKFVVGPPYIRFYAGARIIVAGSIIGSFCITDPNPRTSFSLSEQMLLLSFGAMVSNAIVMRRSRELRLRDKVDRPLRMKFYTDMHFLSLKHNLRTPVSNLSLSILDLIHENSKNQLINPQPSYEFKKLILEQLQNQTFLLQKVIEICLIAIEILIRYEDQQKYIDHLKNLHKKSQQRNQKELNSNSRNNSNNINNISNSNNNSNNYNEIDNNENVTEEEEEEDTYPSANGIICNLSSIACRFEKIIEILQSLNPNSDNSSKIQFICNIRSFIDQKANYLIIERTFPQLFFTFVTITICLMVILTHHPEILSIVISIEPEITSNTESECKLERSSRSFNKLSDSNVITKEFIERKIGKLCLRISIKYQSELDHNIFNGVKHAYKNAKLIQMIQSVGGDINIINDDKNNFLRLNFWLPYEREIFSKIPTPTPSFSQKGNQLTQTSIKHEYIFHHQTKKQPVPLKILIIDDSIKIQNIIREYFQQFNCEINTCVNGELGLSELKKSTTLQIDSELDDNSKNQNKSKFVIQCKYDLVFVDLLMPTKSGVEMLKNYIDWMTQTFIVYNNSIKRFNQYRKNFINTIFIGLLPPYCSFSEMINDDYHSDNPFDLNNNDPNNTGTKKNFHDEDYEDNDNDKDNDENRNKNDDNENDDPDPDDYGFDGMILKPFKMIDILELLPIIREDRQRQKMIEFNSRINQIIPTALDTAALDYSSNRARFEQIKANDRQPQYEQHEQSTDQIIVAKKGFFSFLTDKLRKIKIHVSG